MITLRGEKGTPLTTAEMDANFAKVRQLDNPRAGVLTPYPNNQVLCMIGDSNTVYGSWATAMSSILFDEGGVFENWTVYNSASNGARLRDWAASVASGSQVPSEGCDRARSSLC